MMDAINLIHEKYQAIRYPEFVSCISDALSDKLNASITALTILKGL